MSIDWDGVAQEADWQPINRMRAWVAEAEQKNVKPIAFAGLVLYDIQEGQSSGDCIYDYRGSRITIIGMLQNYLDILRQEALRDIEP